MYHLKLVLSIYAHIYIYIYICYKVVFLHDFLCVPFFGWFIPTSTMVHHVPRLPLRNRPGADQRSAAPKVVVQRRSAAQRTSQLEAELPLPGAPTTLEQGVQRAVESIEL